MVREALRDAAAGKAADTAPGIGSVEAYRNPSAEFVAFAKQASGAGRAGKRRGIKELGQEVKARKDGDLKSVARET